MNTTPKKIKILLIDDDEMMRIFFRDFFWIHGSSEKYDVAISASIEEAEKRIQNGDIPDTIFMGMMMKIKNGDNSHDSQVKRTLDFIHKVKTDKELGSIKIIIYTSHNEQSMRDAVGKLGTDGYLIKGELMPTEIIAFTDKIHEFHN